MSEEKSEFSNPKLSIELVPKSSHYRNLRSELSSEAWDAIRKKVYRRADYRCEICGGQGDRHPVECHEVWEYDDEEKLQSLSGFLALCPDCHAVKHMGRSMVEGHGDHATKHLAEVNGWSLRQARRYTNDKMAEWTDRSRHQWEIDVSLLEESPYKDWLEGMDISGFEDES